MTNPGAVLPLECRAAAAMEAALRDGGNGRRVPSLFDCAAVARGVVVHSALRPGRRLKTGKEMEMQRDHRPRG
jgi:hypothetical protein